MTYVPAADLSTRKIGDELVLMDMKSGTYFGLDGVGAFVWGLLQQGLDEPQIVDAVTASYEVTRQDAQRDLELLLKDLLDSQLIAPKTD